MLKKIIAVFVSAFVLSGCAHVNLWTALKFANVDFLDVNPETARVAAVLPPGVDFSSVSVVVKGTRGGDTVLDYEIPMELVRSGPETAQLPHSISKDRTLIVRVPRADIARVRTLQLETAQFLESDGDNSSLSLGFNLISDENLETQKAVCSDEATSFTMAVWVKLEKGAPYSKLLSENAFATIVEQSVKQNTCS